MSLPALIKALISREGAISVADYMGLALGDESDGYYMTKDPLGLSGDFITSPEISQVFGELIGIWAAECWIQMEKPEVDIVEMGPGRGTLMADFLRGTRHIKGFHDAAHIHMVEMSPVLRDAQKKTLKDKHPRIHWHRLLPDLKRPLLIIGNEFFDALPIRQFIATKTGFCERMVDMGKGEGNFVFSRGKALPRLPGDYPETEPGTIPEGSIIEQCPLAQKLMRDIALKITRQGGAGLFIDYGYERPKKESGFCAGDTLQAVLSHAYHDVLSSPGKADITAHVDFTTLAKIARSAGVEVPAIVNQRLFLNQMGGLVRVRQLCQHATDSAQKKTLMRSYERLTSLKEMGRLFKVMALVSPGIKAPVFHA